MKRRRSPLSGASSSQLAALRALVVAYRDWERRAGTPEQSLSATVPAIGRHLSLPVQVEQDIEARVTRRLAERPDAAAIFARRDELRAHNPATGALTIALAGIHDELTRIRASYERGTAHGEVDREDVTP